MADEPALRQRRYRLHKRGDHSLCVVDRCPEVTPPVTRNTTSDQGERTSGLAAAGRNLWSLMTAGAMLGPMQKVLLLEACRIVDRLEKLDAQLRGVDREFLTLEPLDEDDVDRTYVLIVDKALSESRQQAATLKGLLAEIRQAGRTGVRPASGTGAPAREDGPKEGSLADLTARIRERARTSQTAD
ncbi:hypothetical protein [Lentzea sp. NPDC059081]|uniref:hypothetical protein n=1 Tax=Lentzea sp. NPDC059081 TaxID=3346719 RepID=UPI00368420CB